MSKAPNSKIINKYKVLESQCAQQWARKIVKRQPWKGIKIIVRMPHKTCVKKGKRDPRKIVCDTSQYHWKLYWKQVIAGHHNKLEFMAGALKLSSSSRALKCSSRDWQNMIIIYANTQLEQLYLHSMNEERNHFRRNTFIVHLAWCNLLLREGITKKPFNENEPFIKIKIWNLLGQDGEGNLLKHFPSTY